MDGLQLLKPSVFVQTNQTNVKGLFTHRTIQFSMSSGCHRQSGFTQKSSRTFPSLRPIQGTKNLSAEFSLPHSATEFSLRGDQFTQAPETVKNFFRFSFSAFCSPA